MNANSMLLRTCLLHELRRRVSRCQMLLLRRPRTRMLNNYEKNPIKDLEFGSRRGRGRKESKNLKRSNHLSLLITLCYYNYYKSQQ